MAIIPIAELREWLAYDAETGGVFWLKQANRVTKGSFAGSRGGDRYIRIRVAGYRVLAHHVAWALQTGTWPTKFIDHIDGDPSNNVFSNLREATNAENMRNRGYQKNNTTGFKGVSWDRRAGKFRARITVNRKMRFLGHFASVEEAAAAYRQAAPKSHGEFAHF